MSVDSCGNNLPFAHVCIIFSLLKENSDQANVRDVFCLNLGRASTVDRHSLWAFPGGMSESEGREGPWAGYASYEAKGLDWFSRVHWFVWFRYIYIIVFTHALCRALLGF